MAKKSKICYSNPTILMKRPVAQIAELVGKTNKVSIIIPRKAFKKRDKSAHYSDTKVKIIDYPTVSPPLMWDWPIFGFDFFKKTWNIWKKNDIVHMWIPFYLSNFTLALYKLLFFRNKKLIVTMDTVPAYSFSMGGLMNIIFKIFYRTCAKVVFWAADEITLYGESFEYYANKGGIPMHKIKITPTGVNVNVKKKDKDVRKELGIKKSEKMVLFAGLLVPRKGIDLLIETAEQSPEVKFVLLGDGPNRSDYEKMVKKKGLENVTFCGFRKDVHNFYHATNLFFLPSRGEGFAGVILEAMSYGVPVVSSKIPGTMDLIKDGENGVLCPMESADSYAVAIRRLLKNGTKMRKFSRKGKEKIRKDFSWTNNIKNFKRLY